MKRATHSAVQKKQQIPYFNPRPREEGDITLPSMFGSFLRISIHALVKRATQRLFPDLDYVVISIHALVKRATQEVYVLSGSPCISIHALVKRATPYLDTIEILGKDFNPRPREEGDQYNTVKKECQAPISIHALVKRATALSGRRLISMGDFNPRPREEGDLKLYGQMRKVIISIHALVKRATKVRIM